MRRFLKKFFRIAAPLTLAGLWIGVMLCWLNQWDQLTVVTLIPMWLWAAVGVLGSMLFAVILKSKSCIVIFSVWLLTGLLLSDETRGVGREFWKAIAEKEIVPEENEPVFRVVSMNCDGQRVEAVEAILKLKADVILLQEAPERELLVPLMQKIFEGQGSLVMVRSNAVMARGTLEDPIVVDPINASFRTRLRTMNGLELDVGNVHLARSIPKFSVWKQATLERFVRNRITNRRILRHLVRDRTATPVAREDFPAMIIGGDFSTPPGDDIFRMLEKAELTDASKRAPAGSGNTFPAKFGLLRIDQIWASPGLVPVRVEANRTPVSDHKMLICDFLLRDEGS